MPVRKGKKEEIEQRRLKALSLRTAGASYRAIAAQLAVSHETAFQDVQAALVNIATQAQHSAEALRELELERIDTALLAIAQMVRQGNLGAIDRWLRLGESRRKLLGLDAPTRNEHTGKNGEPLFQKVYEGIDPEAI